MENFCEDCGLMLPLLKKGDCCDACYRVRQMRTKDCDCTLCYRPKKAFSDATKPLSSKFEFVLSNENECESDKSSDDSVCKENDKNVIVNDSRSKSKCKENLSVLSDCKDQYEDLVESVIRKEWEK